MKGALVSDGAYVLVGATGSGKTLVAHTIARTCGAHVLSADSMAVYRGMRIGTAAPDSMLRSEVRYHGLELVDPVEAFSIHDYMQHARKVVAAARDDDAPLIVAGGSGLYIKCLMNGLDETPGADAALREFWSDQVARLGLPALQDEARTRMPAEFESLSDSDRRNARRLIRLLERGGIPESWQDPGRNADQIVGLRFPSVTLKQRLRERAAGMMESGLLEESRALMAKGLNRTASQAIGYSEAIDVLNGKLTQDQAVDLIARRSWRLARKQMTWFRHQAKVSWIDVEPSGSIDTVIEAVWKTWLDAGPAELRI
ncbi:MAG: tRNA (adenosine(37)-N6)-dimethylallyltransferase MiaA [Verrucomicrobia bacterium]|nr:tRNA (adenosine(37)-N6)-dimethylallyltransferase MiaA [Verrucomicrobiota bacterium]MDA1086091.1 tRNA (adenosine(37)-N6)-dimethylallyltransferase MiaA [Verrucomicrobiota bacterium]